MMHVALVGGMLHLARRPGYEVPIVSLDLAFALYLGAFIWLDVVWKLSLGIALFTYVRVTAQHRGTGSQKVVVLAFHALPLGRLWPAARAAVSAPQPAPVG